MTEDEVIAYLEGLTPEALRALWWRLEVRWDVELVDAGWAPVVAMYGMPPDAWERERTFDVVMTDHGPRKLHVVKALRGMMSLGLRESKALVDSAPCVLMKEADSRDVERLRGLEAEGAVIEVIMSGE